MLTSRLWPVVLLSASVGPACDCTPSEVPRSVDSPVLHVPVPAHPLPPHVDQIRALVVPERTLEVGAPHSGFLHRRLETGAQASTGALLYEIETPGARADVEAARAHMRASAYILNGARAELAESQRRLKTLKGLESYVPLDEVNKARVSAILDGTRTGQARAERDVRRAELRRLLANHRAREDHSPFDAVLTRWDVEDGAWVEQGHPVLRLESARETRVRFAVDVEQVARLHIGDRLRAESTRVRQALALIIESIAPRPDEITGFHLVEAHLDADTSLAVGEPLRVTLPPE